MKVVQKVLSHGLLLTFFIAVFLIYLYRVQLFPQWFSVDPSAESVKESASETVAPATPAAESLVEQVAEPEIKADTPTLSSAETETGTAMRREPEGEHASTEDQPIAGQNRYRPLGGMPEASSDESPAETETEKIKKFSAEPPAHEVASADNQVTAGDVKDQVFRPLASENSVEDRGQSPAGDQHVVPEAATGIPDAAIVVQSDRPAGNETADAQLAAARDLFWKQDAGSAEKAYLDITAAYPENADAWGELGNVYFKLGRWSDAADAFFKAANLLIDQGQPERAANMLRVLYGLDSGKGGELEERLKENGSS